MSDISGEVPEGWATTLLFDVCRPTQWPTIATKKMTNSGYPVYGANGQIGYYSSYNHERETILITCRGATCGKLNISLPFSWINGNAMALDDLNIRVAGFKYTYFYLLSRGFDDVISGSAQPQITREGLKDIQIPIAPLAEQRRIVTAVEAMLTQVNAIRDRLNRVPTVLKRFRQAILAAACDGRLTADWREKHACQSVYDAMTTRLQERTKAWPDYDLPIEHSYSDLPEIPTTWKWESVERIASPEPRSMQSGPFGSNLLHSEFQDSGVLAIGIDNVLFGTFSMGRENRISLPKYEELKKYTARPEDVLITVMATVGRVCVVPKELETAIITKHVYRTSVDKEIAAPYFIALALQDDSVVQPQIKGEIIGQTRPGINGQILKRIGIPLPPLPEQHEIVRRVNALFALADQIDAKLTRTKQRVDKLTQAILAKAFRGELVPTEAELARREGREYESAEELLKRVKALSSEAGQPARKSLQRKPKRTSI